MVYVIDENATEATLNVWSEAPATLELYTPDMDMVDRTAVSPLSSPARFTIAPGQYHLRARSLDGRAARVTVTLEAGYNSIHAEDIWGDAAAVKSGVSLTTAEQSVLAGIQFSEQAAASAALLRPDPISKRW